MSDRPRSARPGASPRTGGVLGYLVLAAVGLLSILPPYVGPPLGLHLDVSTDFEVVDHVLPGATVAFFAGVAAHQTRAGAGGSALVFAVVGCCFLGALFQAVSHVPLLLDAGTPAAPWGATLLHAVPGMLLTTLALSLLLRLGAAQTEPTA